MKLKTISEKLNSIDVFYLENNIDKDEMSYLGEGDFGVAYSISGGRVLKETSSKDEFNLANEWKEMNHLY